MGAVPAEVEANAPRIHLHPEEGFAPMDADTWLEAAKLCWYEAGRLQTAVEPPAGGVFSTPPPGFTFDGHGLTDISRPWQANQRDTGFALTTGADPGSTAIRQPVPVYYEHDPGLSVTYWLFYPWSTVPRRIPGPPGLEGVEAGTVAPEKSIEVLLAEYPELMADAAPPAGPELSVHDALRFVHNWFGSKWPVLHEGDWEGLAVSLVPGERRTAYFQHGRPQERALDEGERPEVYVALGSHASYPDLGESSPGSPKVKRAEKLAAGGELEIELIDVTTKPWYAFGGAWGSAGRISDETGPLGPGPEKGPRPYAR